MKMKQKFKWADQDLGSNGRGSMHEYACEHWVRGFEFALADLRKENESYGYDFHNIRFIEAAAEKEVEWNFNGVPSREEK